ncbi:MspA family porin [Nocardia xishanensis]|uniref:MspA family porin n=1 Tax=Nocardia xishanensis TaxID=238964 RepID=A0ABW7X8N2_9NOCA
MFDRKKAVRAVVLCAAAFTAAGLVSTGQAKADTLVPLPGGSITETLPDGTAVTVRMVDESALISPPMAATPLHRNAWVSASAQVEVAGNAVGGKIRPGYVVGCQVNIGGGGVNGNGTYSSDWEGQRPSGGVGAGGTLSLGPGQAKTFYLLDIEGPDLFGDEVHLPYIQFRGPSGSVTWKNSTIALSGCAGYAQARSFVRVEVDTPRAREIVVFWGQPFSLG